MLMLPGNLIYPVSLTESGFGLVKAEGNSVFHALHMCIQNPGIITDPGFWFGLSAADDTFNLTAVFLQIFPDIDAVYKALGVE